MSMKMHKPWSLGLFGFMFLARGAALAAPAYWGGGAVDLANGTAIPISSNELSGVWDAGTKNWASDYAGTTYGAFPSGSFAVLGFFTSTVNDAKATIRLTTDVRLWGLMASMQSCVGFRHGFVLSNDVQQTITPVGTNFTINIASLDTTRDVQFRSNIVLSGSVPLTKGGAGQLTIYGRSPDYSGDLAIRGGTLKLAGGSDGAGTLPSVTNIIVQGFPSLNGEYGSSYFSTPSFSATAVANGTNDQLNDQAVITLARGRFEYQGRRNNDPANLSTEIIRKLVLAPHGVLDIDAAGVTGATNAGVLVLADLTAGIDRGSTGHGTLLVNVGAGGNPTNDIIVANGYPADVLLPWIETSRAEFMRLNGTTKALETIASLQAPEDLTTWAEDESYRIGLGTNAFTASGELGDLSIKSLGLYANSDVNLTIGSGSTLNIASGALGFQPVQGTRVARISGGSLTTESSELYLHSGDSSAAHVLIIDSAIVGSGMDLIKAGLGEVRFTGTVANTYSGTTYVNNGHLALTKSGVVAVPGPLVIERGGSVGLNGSASQIPSTATVTVHEDGSFSTSASYTHGSKLTLDGGTYMMVNCAPSVSISGEGFAFNGGRVQYTSSSANSFSLQTDVGYSSNSTRQARWLNTSTGNFTVELDGTNRTFSIDQSATLPAEVAEMVMDLPIANGQGSASGCSLTKTGSGTLQLTATNTYAGGTIISNGTLHVAAIHAAALSGLHASLYGTGNGYGQLMMFHSPIATSLVIGQSITGTGVSAGRKVLQVMDDYTIICSDFNSSTDTVDVAIGALSKAGNLGAGPVTLDGGSLLVDGGITLTNDLTQNGGSFFLDGIYDGTMVWNAGLLGGTGTVVQAAVAKGAVSPGRQTLATLNFANDLTLDSSGSLALELGVAGNDRVLVGGTATLGGILAVTNLDASPVLGSAYTVLTATAISGTFAATNVLPALEAGLAWQVNYTGTDVVLAVVEGGGSASPEMGVSPASLDFGGVQVGASSNLTLVVTNSGDAVLTGTAAVSGLPFAVVDGASFIIAAGAASNVVVSFTPVAGETYAGEVVFLSDGGGLTNTLAGYGYILSGSTNTSVSFSGGQFNLSFTLASGALYRVEMTTNLLSGGGWTNLTGQRTNHFSGIPMFGDSGAESSPHRAYRVVSP